MNRNRLYLIIIVTLIISHLVMLFLPFFNGRNEDLPKKEIIKALSFSKEQVDDYGLLIDKHRKTFDSLENKIQEQQKELYKGLRDGASGKVALDSLSLFLGKIEKAKFDHFKELRMLCTPTQKIAFDLLAPKLPVLFSKRKKLKK